MNPILKFNMAFDIEEDWDVLYVEYLINNGDNWQVLGTANDPNWYNSDYTENRLTIGRQWTGTDATLKEYSYNLSNFTNETSIVFRFAFLTDQLVSKEGVIIDDFVITSSLLATNNELVNQFTIYPNPSNGVFTFKRDSNENMSIQITDITGKQIIKINNIINNNYPLNLSHFEKGIYFAKIKIDNISFTEKLIMK